MKSNNSQLKVSDVLIDENNKVHLRFEFGALSGEKGVTEVPRGQILEPRKVCSNLLDAGAHLSPETATSALKEAIDNAPNAPTGRLVSRHGWLDDIYVGHNAVYGSPKLPVVYRPRVDVDAAFKASEGTVGRWREGLRDPIAASSYLTYAASIPFGAALLKPLGIEGGVKNLVGESTTGKTTAARVGQSVLGRADPNDLTTLDLTKRGGEELCESHCDSLVVLDETARLDKNFSRADLEDFIYATAGGRGKTRSAVVAQGGLGNAAWRVIALLTSEVSLEPKKLKRGAALRYAEIPVPPAKAGGIFDKTRLKGAERRARAMALAEQADETIRVNYGVAFPAFMEKVMKNLPRVIEFAEGRMKLFLQKVGVEENAQEKRLASKFAAIYAGGAIAARFGILPCDEPQVFESIRRIYLRSRVTLCSAEEQSPRVLKALFEAARCGNFPLVCKGEELPSTENPVWGIRRDINGERVFVFSLTRLRRLAGSPREATDLLDYWAKRGYLLMSSDGKRTRQVSVCGWSDKRQRLVCLKRSALPSTKRSSGR
jgi:hypothetical protein